jgi:hypothetical protein
MLLSSSEAEKNLSVAFVSQMIFIWKISISKKERKVVCEHYETANQLAECVVYNSENYDS